MSVVTPDMNPNYIWSAQAYDTFFVTQSYIGIICAFDSSKHISVSSEKKNMISCEQSENTNSI